MKIKTRDMTIIAISVALMYILGKLAYGISMLLPIPGSRFITLAPAFSFVIAAAVYKTRKVGTSTLLSIVYGLTLFRFSIFAGLATMAGGIAADIITLIICRKYTDKMIMFTAPLQPALCTIASWIVVTYITLNSRVPMGGPVTMLISSMIVYVIGILGSYSAMKILPRGLK